MKQSEIANLRLINQQVAGTKFKFPEEIVRWMGAMQAQDFRMANWAIGVRLPGSKKKLIVDAINTGKIIRTHLLRPTWHFAVNDDVRWMMELAAPQIKSSLKSRHKVLGFTQSVINKSYSIIEKSLGGGNHLTRDELMTELKKAKIDITENRSSHIMLMAELDMLVCSGSSKKNKQTYALFDERIPKSESLKREDALAKLAERYFTSHGPATLKDFVWWSGLPVADAKKAVELVKSKFISERINGYEYWFSNSINFSNKVKKSVYLLPAYDEFIISYKVRSDVLNPQKNNKAISNNGIFRPVIVVNGKVTGIWKPAVINGKLKIETQFFEKTDIKIKKIISKKFLEFTDF